MNGTNLATALSGVSLISVIGLAVAAGQYKERVDVLVINQAQQQEILLEQREIGTRQKHLVEDLDEVRETLKLILIEMRHAPPE